MSCQDPSAPRASLQKSLPPTEPAVGSVTAKTKRSASASEPAQVRSATGLGVETCKFFFFFERDEKEVERREVTLSERGRSNEVDGAKKRGRDATLPFPPDLHVFRVEKVALISESPSSLAGSFSTPEREL